MRMQSRAGFHGTGARSHLSALGPALPGSSFWQASIGIASRVRGLFALSPVSPDASFWSRRPFPWGARWRVDVKPAGPSLLPPALRVTLVLAAALSLELPAVAAQPQASGQEVYARGCLACHGNDGTGSLPGVPDLTEPSGALSQDLAALLEHVKAGIQRSQSPINMPPRGGDPSLTDADLVATLDYMRSTFLRTP